MFDISRSDTFQNHYGYIVRVTTIISVLIPNHIIYQETTTRPNSLFSIMLVLDASFSIFSRNGTFRNRYGLNFSVRKMIFVFIPSSIIHKEISGLTTTRHVRLNSPFVSRSVATPPHGTTIRTSIFLHGKVLFNTEWQVIFVLVAHG